MYSINSCNDSLRALTLFPWYDSQKSHNSRKGSHMLITERIIKASLERYYWRATKARTLKRAQKVDWTARQQTEDFWVYSFFLPGQASIVWSVHSAIQHSDGSGGVSSIVREEALDPSGLVWFERHLVSPCPRSQNPSRRAALPTGPRSKNRWHKTLRGRLVAEP